MKAKDTEIEALQAKVAEAAKTAEATERLGKEIADLKARLADKRTEFALRSAGARSVTAAKALLAEHDGDVAALAKAEPWLFETKDPSQGGATELEPVGASGGSDDQYMKHWERIAGLADEGKEGQDMPNNIAAIKKYTTILDRVYQREATSSCLNSLARMARAGRNAKEIMIPKVSMTGFGTSSELIESRATQHVRRPSSPICCCMRFSISLNTCLRTAELPQTSST